MIIYCMRVQISEGMCRVFVDIYVSHPRHCLSFSLTTKTPRLIFYHFFQSSAHFRLQAQWFCPGCLSAAAWFGLILSTQHPLPPRSRPGAGESGDSHGGHDPASDEAKPAAPVEPCAHSDHWSHDANISGSTFGELKEWKPSDGKLFGIFHGFSESDLRVMLKQHLGGCWWMLVDVGGLADAGTSSTMLNRNQLQSM